MPELPEVEAFKQYFDQTSLDQKIRILKIKDAKTLAADEVHLLQAVDGQKFEESQRIGKYLLARTSNGHWVMFHFGMTGYLEYSANSVPLPRFARIILYFEYNYRLSFICPRKFGRVNVFKSLEDFHKAKKLSDDALVISLDNFQANIQKRKAAIKSVLLDQKVCAGIGNWIADEMLFQAKIHPEKRANTLAFAQLQLLYDKMKEILTTAIKVDADYNQYPDSYIIHRRGWTDLDTDTCANCQSPIDYFKVGGRATYACPNCQKS